MILIGYLSFRYIYTVCVPSFATTIFMLKYFKKPAIKKIDTVRHCVFLSSGFATTVSYDHNCPSDSGRDGFVVVGDEQDKRGNPG